MWTKITNWTKNEYTNFSVNYQKDLLKFLFLYDSKYSFNHSYSKIEILYETSFTIDSKNAVINIGCRFTRGFTFIQGNQQLRQKNEDVTVVVYPRVQKIFLVILQEVLNMPTMHHEKYVQFYLSNLLTKFIETFHLNFSKTQKQLTLHIK